MLYSEFLSGTQAPDNAHTYKEYQRIEAIYNADNSMDKLDAYKLYEKPSEDIQYLLDAIADLKYDCMEYRANIRKLERENEDLTNQVKELERNKKTLAFIFQDCLKEVDICRSRIESMMYD